MKDEIRQTQENEKKKKSRPTSKQVVAMIGVILLILLYVMTLILALADNSASHSFFAMSLAGTLVIPIIIFLYTWMYGRITGKKAIGDPDSAALDTKDDKTEA